MGKFLTLLLQATKQAHKKIQKVLRRMQGKGMGMLKVSMLLFKTSWM